MKEGHRSHMICESVLLWRVLFPYSLEWGTVQGLNQATWLLKLEVFHPLLLRVGSLPAAF